tara:strand:+ start:255 stop:449 length:195 start_codon:yes stop_codon:yes gene_type:complete
MNLCITIITSNQFEIHLTENYEGDKYHVVVYEPSASTPLPHYETIGFNTAKQVFEYIKELEKMF